MFIVTPGLLWNQDIVSEVSDNVDRGRVCELTTEAEFVTMASELYKGFILVCLSLLKNPHLMKGQSKVYGLSIISSIAANVFNLIEPSEACLLWYK